MAKTIAIPPELVRFYLPGLEVALKSLVEKVNSVKLAAGQTDLFRLVNGTEATPPQHGSDHSLSSAYADDSPATTKRTRRISAAGKRAISEAQKKRWAARRAGNPAPSRRGRHLLTPAGIDVLTEWARQHDGELDIAAFKEANPDLGAGNVAPALRQGLFKPTRRKKVYLLTKQIE